MITRKPIIILITTLFVSPLLLAQHNFRLELLAGASLNNQSTGVFSNWGNGWTVGAGASYPLRESLDLDLNATYAHYPYRGGNVQIAVPQIVGFRLNLSGQPSSILEASLAIRFTTLGSPINPFFSLRAGLYRISLGEIQVSSWLDSNPQNISQSTYSGSGVSDNKGFAALGVGFSVPLGTRIRLNFEGRLTQTFDSKEKFIPLLSSLQFDL
jgi:hypothetical protein